MIKTFKFLVLLAAGACFVVFADESQAQDPIDKLDAVCKTDPLPAGFVAVGELESPECKESSVGKKNAWLIDRVRDNIASCASPNYADGFPPAIAYMVCQRVSAPRCAPNLDGTPNAFQLTLGSTCNSPRIKSNCGLDLKYDPEKPDFKRRSEIASWYIAKFKEHPDCKDSWGGDYFRQKALYIDKLNNGEQLPLCSALNPYALERLAGDNRFNDTKHIIIRQFYTDLCPNYVIKEQAQKHNAFVVQKLEKKGLYERDVFMCSSSLEKKNRIPIEIIPGSGGQTVRETAAEAFDTGFYTVKKVFQDDRCGAGADLNAYTVRFEPAPK